MLDDFVFTEEEVEEVEPRSRSRSRAKPAARTKTKTVGRNSPSPRSDDLNDDFEYAYDGTTGEASVSDAEFAHDGACDAGESSMDDIIDDSGDISDDESSGKVENALKYFLSLAALVVCLGFVWWFFISPAMVPASVSVSGFPGFSTPEVLRQAGIRERATFLSVNASRAQTLLSRYPLVESARVVKTFPDRIFIHLEPRKAVAVGVARIDGRMQPVYFDRYGFAFMFGDGPGIPPPPGSVPVVSGIYRGDVSLGLGTRLSDSLLPLFSRIGGITDADRTIWKAISEIVVEWNENGTYDLVLYPTNSLVRIRMGSDMDAGAIRYALLMLDVVRGNGDAHGSGGIEEIDARSGIGVLRGEGAGFGK